MAAPTAPHKRSLVAGASAWALGLYAALLPFHAVGIHRARDLSRLEPADAVLALASPVVLLALYRARATLLAEPLWLAVVWLSCAELLSEALGGPVAKGRLVQAVLPILAVGGIAAAAAAGKLGLVLRGLLWGGALALAVAAMGFALRLFGVLDIPGAFVFRSAHPIFPGVPRLTGTFGAHAVWLGEYCIALLAVALGAGQGAGSRCLRAGTASAAAVALLLSFSFAWLGGLVLAARAVLGRLSPALGVRRAVWLGVLVLYVVASWLLLIGTPFGTAGAVERPCTELDRLHHVSRPTGPGLCSLVLSETPYRHRVTLYALAHATALESYALHPVLGLPRQRYRELAGERARSVHGMESHGYYAEPIGLVAGTLARTGTLGAAGLALLLLGVWRAQPRGMGAARGGGWAFYGTIALLLCATQTDLALRGSLWLLVGWLAAEPGAIPGPAPSVGAVAANEPQL